MVTTLYLIRHGETEGSEVKRYKGSIDVPLSETGRRQIGDTARFLERYVADAGPSQYGSYLRSIHRPGDDSPDDDGPAQAIAAVYCSDLVRARESAGIIAQPYGLTPVMMPSLRERHFGDWEGLSFDEIRQRNPDEFLSWAENPLDFSPVGGESTREVLERVQPALSTIVGHHEGEHIAVVAHGGVNRIILCIYLGLPLENMFRIEQDYGALNIIEFWDAYPVVKLINGRAEI